MFRILKKNQKGFTLVEVIVVAVIVAVLALVAIQLYQGYVREARSNTAENLAASAASFLQAAENVTQNYNPATPLIAGGTWTSTMPTSGEVITFACPANARLTVAGNNVTAEIGNNTGAGGAFVVLESATRAWR